MKRLLFAMGIAFIITAAAVTLHAETSADAIIGKWYTADNESIVEIYKVGEKYFGKIIWLDEPLNDDGTAKVDKNNPDESKRTQPIIGLVIVRNFVYQGNAKWGNGKIYDPDNGKTYDCFMTLSGNELHVRGYIGLSVIGRTTTWVRVQE